MTRREMWLASPLRRQLIDARRATRMSLRVVAARLDVSTAALSSYERGDRVPSVPTLEKIFAGYGLDLLAAPKGTPASLTTVAAETAEQLRTLANRLDRPMLRVVAA
jgi:transcriptional regulator with XRE-family HTH domain